MTRVFLHGLESSSRGTKAVWFRERFPDMVIPDFTGPLAARLEKLNEILAGKDRLVLVGSSFGGLMAALYACDNEKRVARVVLLAPALNFPEFSARSHSRVHVPASLYVGIRDTVCPPEKVVPPAQEIFADLSIQVSDDDHLLRDTFLKIDWDSLLAL